MKKTVTIIAVVLGLALLVAVLLQRSPDEDFGDGGEQVGDVFEERNEDSKNVKAEDMIVKTTHCGDYGHPEFSLNCEGLEQSDINWLISFFEESVRDGAKYKDDETVQIGSMITTVKVRSDGTLGLYEPDMKSFPINWVDSVFRTSRQLHLQKYVVESFWTDGSMNFPTILHSCIVGEDLTNDTRYFIMERLEGKGSDSGWFIGDAESKLDYNTPGTLRRESLYSAILLKPQIFKFIGLPEGTYLAESNEGFEFFFKDEKIDPIKGSYIDELKLHTGKKLK